VLSERPIHYCPARRHVATSIYNIAGLKETGDWEGARRLFLECKQIYAKALGADMRRHYMLQRARRLLVKKRRMKRGGKEIATKEKRRIKREIARKENSTVMTSLSQ